MDARIADFERRVTQALGRISKDEALMQELSRFASDSFTTEQHSKLAAILNVCLHIELNGDQDVECIERIFSVLRHLGELDKIRAALDSTSILSEAKWHAYAAPPISVFRAETFVTLLNK